MSRDIVDRLGGVQEPYFQDLAAEAKTAIEKLRALLKEHHQWHLDQGEVSAPDGKGGHVTWDAAEAYAESDFYDRTAAALAATSMKPDIPSTGERE